jgi:hypothetical protein
MQACEEKEENEVAVVTESDTGPYPRAMMVVYLHTHITGAAMKGTRRSQNLASFAIGQPFDSLHQNFSLSSA